MRPWQQQLDALVNDVRELVDQWLTGHVQDVVHGKALHALLPDAEGEAGE